MHDIRTIRENPDAFDNGLARRGLPGMAAELLAVDQERRYAISQAEASQFHANKLSEQAGIAKKAGDNEAFVACRAGILSRKQEIVEQTEHAKRLDALLRNMLLAIPNLPLDGVPDGIDERGNEELRTGNAKPRKFDFTPKEHFDIDGVKPGMDFATAAKLSGSRFVVLKGAVATVHRALAQLMLDIHVNEHLLTEMWTPVLVKNDAMVGTDQLPKFSEDSFFGASMTGRKKQTRQAIMEKVTPEDITKIENGTEEFVDIVEEIFGRADTKEEFWLIPTAEVTLTNTVAGDILDEAALPIQMVAHTQCFRSEAGSAGKDTSGMLRQHQFEKVEMVSITTPETSLFEHGEMTKRAEAILERLGLPYRTIVLCTGDMGFGATKTHDLEVWLPGQNTYREISSVSVCGDFQARRMNARFKAPGGKPDFVHTLNGSGLAVGRCLIAVVENGQQADGSVDLPEALHLYLGGKTRISAAGQLV